MPNEITAIPAELAIALLDFLPAERFDTDALLLRSGILISTSDLQQQPPNAISRVQFSALFREVFALLKKLDTTTSAAAWLGNEEFRMLCHCIIHRKTLGEAIEQAMRFEKMLKREDIALNTEQPNQQAKLEYKQLSNKPSVSALISDLLSLSYYHRLYNWLIGERIPVNALEVYYDELLDKNALEDLFQIPLRFNQPGNYFLFPKTYLEKPIVRTVDELDSLLDIDLFPFDLFFDGASQLSFSELIGQQFRNLLSSGRLLPNLDQLAAYYNLSETTLRRRLTSEGSSISKIKEQSRMDLAKELLAKTHLPIDEISMRVGFSDSSTFRRAFKQRQNETPTQYRRNHSV